MVLFVDTVDVHQAQILQIEGDAAPDDYDKLSRWWLRRQYDIALQQRYFKEHTMMATLGQTEGATPKSQLDKEEIK